MKTSQAGGTGDFQETKESGSVSIWEHVERKPERASGPWGGLLKAWGTSEKEANMEVK